MLKMNKKGYLIRVYPDEMLHYYFVASEKIPEIEIHHFLVISTCEPLKYNMDYPIFVALFCVGKSTRIQRVNALSLDISRNLHLKR